MTSMKVVKGGAEVHTSPLRQRQKEMTRDTILKTVADVVAEGRGLTFTVQELADRAGVSHRSMYRYFPTREALLKALYDRGQEFLELPPGPTSPDEIPLLAEKLFSTFDKQPAWIRGWAIASTWTRVRSTSAVRRNKALEQVIAGITSNLDPHEAQRAFAVIRYLISSQAWLALREQFRLDPCEASKAVMWATRTLIKDVEKRDAEAKRRLGATKRRSQ